MPTPDRLDLVRVVLVATRNPLNLGAAARAMSNFGFTRLRVVKPYAPAFREARSAVGAGHVLAAAQQFDTVAEAVADCRLVVGTTAVGQRGLHHSLRRLESGARAIRKAIAGPAGSPVALLFGSEKTGLSNEDFSHCHWLMRIPTCETNISMNLGQAVAVCLYELVRNGAGPGVRSPVVPAHRDPKPDRTGSGRVAGVRTASREGLATAGQLERVSDLLLDAMVASGYLKRKPTSDAQARLRRLVRRLRLPASDAAAWLGILRQIVWKFHHPGNPAR